MEGVVSPELAEDELSVRIAPLLLSDMSDGESRWVSLRLGEECSVKDAANGLDRRVSVRKTALGASILGRRILCINTDSSSVWDDVDATLDGGRAKSTEEAGRGRREESFGIVEVDGHDGRTVNSDDRVRVRGRVVGTRPETALRILSLWCFVT